MTFPELVIGTSDIARVAFPVVVLIIALKLVFECGVEMSDHYKLYTQARMTKEKLKNVYLRCAVTKQEVPKDIQELFLQNEEVLSKERTTIIELNEKLNR